MTAYYNENDPKKAAWLRELIAEGHIAPGDVDERSIEDVKPYELFNYTQCHFFAGIGIWSYALRLAEWPDDTPVWTGSCPCQPFSLAGAQVGFADERHLWPAWHWLIEQCAPNVIFGEQVANGDGKAWLDLVSTDLENAAYAVGAICAPACGFGAPHIRQRVYFVAHIDGRDARAKRQQCGGEQRFQSQSGECIGELGDSYDVQSEQPAGERARPGKTQSGRPFSKLTRPSNTNGHWHDAEWLPCRDGKARPTEPGVSPLARGATERVVRLRGYGDGIVAPQAAEFIKAYRKIII